MNGRHSAKIVVGLSVPGVATLHSFLATCDRNALEIVLGFNGFLQFDAIFKEDLSRRAEAKKTNIMTILNRNFAKVVLVSSFALQFMMPNSIFWLTPCTPALLGYQILEECNPNTNDSPFVMILNIVIKFLVFLTNNLIWIVGFSTAPLILSGGMILSSCATDAYLDVFSLQAGKEKNINNYSKMYRFIQVLSLLMDEILKDVLLTLIGDAIVLSSFSLVAMVRLERTMANVMWLGVVGVLLINSICVFTILLGGMVGVHDKSEHGLQDVRNFARHQRCLGQKDRKWLTKFCRSCAPIKVKLGYCNFLEKQTPLMCISSAIDLTSIKFRWDAKSQKLKLLNTKEQNRVNIKYRFHKLLTYILVVQTVLGFKNVVNGSHSTKIVVGLSVPGIATIHSFLETCDRNALEIVLGFNGFLQFDAIHKRGLSRRNEAKRINILTIFNLIFAELVLVSTVALQFMMPNSIFWLTPCTPALFGYQILEECNPNSTEAPSGLVWNIIIKFLIFLINQHHWIVGFSTAPLIISGGMILSSLALDAYLDVFSLQAGKEKHINNYRKMYRFIQVLSLLMDEILKDVLLTLIGDAIVLSSFSLVAIVRLERNMANLMWLGVVGLMLINSICVFTILLGGMVGLHDKSEQGLHDVRNFARHQRYLGQKDRKWLTKFCRSCAPIKVKLGYCNFLEKKTPLMCISLAIDLTVQLLLLAT
ncbi:unnamed protein product [Orchesella dallaii]|uniref:Uncharacterized protein n=1 Tax=Orchesella dallaii TaxID=48710 RepID=A0ABP1S7Q8_9HEXA